MRDIKFSYIWSDGKSFMDLRHTLDQIEFGLNVTKLDDDVLADYKIIAKRQYTGLKDKNGAEIYESDILNAPLNKGTYVVRHGPYINGMIDYDGEKPDCYGWYIERIDRKTQGYGESLIWSEKYLEVTGNIHENGELLEGIE